MMENMNNDLTRISKFLSYILRHSPESIGIVLDKNGWASIDDIIKGAKDPVTYDQIIQVVEQNEKKRFALDENKKHIRANQGHSVKVDVQLKKAVPPVVLYHGTVSKCIGDILKKGLLKMSRQHVHLSADAETAEKVGSRRGKPIILKIDTFNMLRDGFEFFISDNGVWLTDNVPAKYLVLR